MHGRKWRRFSQAIAVSIAIIMSGVLQAGAALAAGELLEVEVVSGIDNAVVQVAQGQSVTVDVRVSAAGNISETITEANPTRVTIPTRYTVSSSGTTANTQSDSCAFYSDGKNGILPTTAYVVPVTITAASNAPVGDRTVRLNATISNPAGLPPGQTILDGTIDSMVVRVVSGDSVAPVTTAVLSGTNGANGWYVSPVSVSLSAADSGSGVASTEYSLDGRTSWQAYATPFTVSDEGASTIYVHSQDRAGNIEADQPVSLAIDLTDPVVDITGIANGDYRPSANVVIGGHDDTPGQSIAAISATLDGETFIGGPVTEEGHHELAVIVTNAAGRSASRSLSFDVDSSAPSIVIDNPADGGAYNTPQIFAYRVSDADSLLATSSVPALGDLFAGEGAHVGLVQAWDRAGNRAFAGVSFIIDTTAPQTTPALDGTTGLNGWWVSPVDVTLSAIDPLSGDVRSGVAGTSWRDSSPWNAYDGSFTLTSEGVHTLDFYSRDNAGNAEEASSATVMIDTSAPTVSLDVNGTSGTNGWYTSAVTLEASGDDAISGLAYIRYDLDHSGPQTYGGALTLGEGEHDVSATSVDVAGNESAAAAADIKVDTTVPSTSCSVAGAEGENGWLLGTATVTLTGTDATSKVARTEYSTDDGANWTEYDGPFTIAADGLTTVLYRSVDNAGNLENAQSEVVAIDTEDPIATPSGVSDGAWIRSATIGFSGDDPTPGSGLARVSATLNGTPVEAGTVVDTEGDYTLAVTAEDNAGRTSTSSLSFTIDQTAPNITIASPADDGAYNTTQTLDFSVTDRDPEFGYQSNYLNGHEFADEGPYVVAISAWDRAGNTASNGISFIIDTTAPTADKALSGTLGKNDWWVSSVGVLLTADDPESSLVAAGIDRIMCRVNGGEWQQYAGSLTVDAEGVNTVDFYAVDRAGNAGEPQTISIPIDKTSPALTPSAQLSSTAIRGYGDSMAVDFSVTDDISGLDTVVATVNGAAVSRGDLVSLTKPGLNTIVIDAYDRAGNHTHFENTFIVAFGFGGWRTPVSLDHTWNPGRMLPVKFTVLDYEGRPTGAAVAWVEAKMGSTVIASGLAYVQYDDGVPVYQFNVKTVKGQSGDLVITVNLNDQVTSPRTTVRLLK